MYAAAGMLVTSVDKSGVVNKLPGAGQDLGQVHRELGPAALRGARQLPHGAVPQQVARAGASHGYRPRRLGRHRSEDQPYR